MIAHKQGLVRETNQQGHTISLFKENKSLMLNVGIPITAGIC